MKTIKWLVSQVPEPVKALVAVLLIAISALTTSVVYLFKENKEIHANCEKTVENVRTFYRQRQDSLAFELKITRDNAKREAVQALERIIKEQKEIIEQQRKEKENNSKQIRGNNDKLKSFKS